MATVLANDKVARLDFDRVPVKVRDWLTRYPTSRIDRARRRRETVLDGARSGGSTGRRDRAGQGRRRRRASPRRGRARRSPGRWPAATTARSAARRSTASPVWLGSAPLFLLGLADLRRPLSLAEPRPPRAARRSRWRSGSSTTANIFRCVPLAYPPLRLSARPRVWIGVRGRRVRPARPIACRSGCWLPRRSSWWASGSASTSSDSNVIDVGYAGVIGADRIVARRSAVRPLPDRGRPARRAGPRTRDGEIRDRIQTNGRCESANPLRRHLRAGRLRGYMPGYCDPRLDGEVGRPAGRALDVDHLRRPLRVGLGLVGLRFGGSRLGVALAFAWAAFPFTQYVSIRTRTTRSCPRSSSGLLAPELAARRRNALGARRAGRSSRRSSSRRCG